MIIAKFSTAGRPKKTKLWRETESEIRRCLPYMLRLKKSEASRLMRGNPTLAEMAIYTYIARDPAKALEKFLPSAWADEPPAIDFVPEAIRRELESDSIPAEAS
ncbi:MAG: hypothetical protein KGJ13_08455 [Patescibacteria group bacterium]|nr:hypothetical protein [Patescibacteria group bacterium]